MKPSDVKLTLALKAFAVKQGWCKETSTDDQFTQAISDNFGKGISQEKYDELTTDKSDNSDTLDKLADRVVSKLTSNAGGGTGTKTKQAMSLFSNIRVKASGESYSTDRKSATHKRTGESVKDGQGRIVELPSEYDYALAGSFLKLLAQRQGRTVPLTDHERGLREELFERNWAGDINGEYFPELDGAEVKTLLDDSTSGGLEITPIEFDDLIVTFPLLHSEILPFVETIDLTRGRRIEGGTIDNVDLVWGTAEGGAISEFSTDDLVTALDTNVHNLTCAITMGRDFLSDSPASVGEILVRNIGERLMQELDKVIIGGSGSTEPEGINQKSGIAGVNSANGTGGPPTMSDLEALIFSIDKQYRRPMMNPRFISTDTTFRRVHAIPVGPSDQRRVLGMDVQNYMTYGFGHSVENDGQLTNSEGLFCALRKYRLYRRLGSRIEFSREGQTLMLNNEELLVFRARYGGQLTDSNAAGYIQDWQS